MVALSGHDSKALGLASANIFLFHQPVQAVAAMTLPTCPQRRLDARSTVRLAALLVNLADLLLQALIFQGSWPRLILPVAPCIIAAFRNSKRVAEHAHAVVRFQRVDPCEALLGDSERMPKVFFRMSRCSRK